MSIRDAAELLGLEERAVRLMAADGRLRAVKRGNAWWVDRRDVERRSRRRPGRGRPLSAPMAWWVLLLASDDREHAEPLGEEHHPSRAQRWLESHSLVDDALQLRDRARRESFDAHPSELARLADGTVTIRTGISAASAVGVHGGGDSVELYAPAGRRDELIREHGLEPGEGPVVIRWVPDDIWPSLDRGVAPRAAVLIDLLEHDDPRARREAERALRE